MTRITKVLVVFLGLGLFMTTSGMFLLAGIFFGPSPERIGRVEDVYGVPIDYSQGVTKDEAEATSKCFRSCRWVGEHSRLNIQLTRVNGRIHIIIGAHSRIDGRPVRYWNETDQLVMGYTLSHVAFKSEPLSVTFENSKNATGGSLQIEPTR